MPNGHALMMQADRACIVALKPLRQVTLLAAGRYWRANPGWKGYKRSGVVNPALAASGLAGRGAATKVTYLTETGTTVRLRANFGAEPSAPTARADFGWVCPIDCVVACNWGPFDGACE